MNNNEKIRAQFKEAIENSSLPEKIKDLIRFLGAILLKHEKRDLTLINNLRPLGMHLLKTGDHQGNEILMDALMEFSEPINETHENSSTAPKGAGSDPEHG